MTFFPPELEILYYNVLLGNCLSLKKKIEPSPTYYTVFNYFLPFFLPSYDCYETFKNLKKILILPLVLLFCFYPIPLKRLSSSFSPPPPTLPFPSFLLYSSFLPFSSSHLLHLPWTKNGSYDWIWALIIRNVLPLFVFTLFLF